jgi:hypothetical protein
MYAFAVTGLRVAVERCIGDNKSYRETVKRHERMRQDYPEISALMTNHHLFGHFGEVAALKAVSVSHGIRKFVVSENQAAFLQRAIGTGFLPEPEGDHHRLGVLVVEAYRSPRT